MRKIAYVLYGITLFAIFILGSMDVNEMTIWTVVFAVISMIPALIGKVIERCLED